jgi:hypothetical protein
VESYSASVNGFTAWGGFTANAGDLIWFRPDGTNTIPVAFTVAKGVTANAGERKTITLLETFGSPYTIAAGRTFEIERAKSNAAYVSFVNTLRHARSVLRSNSSIDQNGFSPWITSPTVYSPVNSNDTGANNGYHFWEDERYWWEMCYHLLVSGTKFFQVWNPGQIGADGVNDGDAYSIHKVLSNWRSISGNAKCKPVTKTNFALNSPVIVSGGQIQDGANSGLYIWRLTVRPGLLSETVTLTQTTRKDIPEKLVIPGGYFTDHINTGTRGVWLITTSSVVPVYTIA